MAIMAVETLAPGNPGVFPPKMKRIANNREVNLPGDLQDWVP